MNLNLLAGLAGAAQKCADNKRAKEDEEFSRRLASTRRWTGIYFISCLVLFIISFFMHTDEYTPAGGLILINIMTFIFAFIGMFGKKPWLISLSTIVLIVSNLFF